MLIPNAKAEWRNANEFPMCNGQYEQLSARLPTDAMRTILAGAIHTSRDRANPIRGNGFAFAMRELISQLLDELAPAPQVVACSWFESQTEDGRPTRAQRQQYVIQGGLTDAYVNDTLGVDTEGLRTELRDAFIALNRATHVREGTIITADEEVAALVTRGLSAANGLFDAVDDCRGQLLSAVTEAITDAVTDEMLSRTIEEIDEKAGSYSIAYISTDEIMATEIDAANVRYRVTGSIHAELHYGSVSDGATIDHDFPFDCNLAAPVADPRAFDTDMTVLRVDHGGWYD